ncbi:MAG TPA: glycosyltransferase [Phenylobacterium sp.]|uniref:glycosyltransferase n=1 Tax=Phenylobacterium sp. TaxID=1871053 RepID=UPI002B4818A7|nr:glycosyltransferase [Phenylobacterium sp.]HKR88366.1 glycosyltransferase [Phenylobacterium sp.]
MIGLVNRDQSAPAFGAASAGLMDKSARQVFDVVSPGSEKLVRFDPAEANLAHGPLATGYHLVDTTMMYAPNSGGVKRYLTVKHAWLKKHRPDIRQTLVVPGARTRRDGEGLVTVAATRLPFADGYRMPASVSKWASVIRTCDPDIIEAGDVLVPGHGALEAGEALGVPVVGFCHTDAAALAALHLGDWAEQPTFNLWAQAYQRFDLVVAPSRHTASRLAEAGVEKVTVLPFGVDTELFHPSRGDRAKLFKKLGLAPEARLLVFAGRPAREKNVESMVAAVEKLGEPYHLLLIGAGRDTRPSDQVICIDYERDPQRLAGLVASCDAFLHANENEIFGLVVLEAMAAGVPVIGPNKGGVGELIDPSVGQHADNSEPESLAAAIEALFARDIGQIAQAARRRAETRHGWEHTFEGLTRLYSSLINRAARPLALSA